MRTGRTSALGRWVDSGTENPESNIGQTPKDLRPSALSALTTEKPHHYTRGQYKQGIRHQNDPDQHCPEKQKLQAGLTPPGVYKLRKKREKKNPHLRVEDIDHDGVTVDPQ